VLEQNKNDAKENDGEKADYDLRAFPSKKGSVSHCGPKLRGSRIPAQTKRPPEGGLTAVARLTLA
jgi:hypothetical protein